MRLVAAGRSRIVIDAIDAVHVTGGSESVLCAGIQIRGRLLGLIEALSVFRLPARGEQKKRREHEQRHFHIWLGKEVGGLSRRWCQGPQRIK